MNITIIEDDGKWQRRSSFSRCLALQMKGKKEQRSSPETHSLGAGVKNSKRGQRKFCCNGGNKEQRGVLKTCSVDGLKDIAAFVPQAIITYIRIISLPKEQSCISNVDVNETINLK